MDLENNNNIYNNFGGGSSNNKINNKSSCRASLSISQKFSYEAYFASKKMNSPSVSDKSTNNDSLKRKNTYGNYGSSNNNSWGNNNNSWVNNTISFTLEVFNYTINEGKINSQVNYNIYTENKYKYTVD